MVVFNTIKYLAKRGHQIDFLFLSGKDVDGAALQELGNWCRPYPVLHHRKNSLASLLLNVFSSKPYSITKYYSNHLKKQFADLLEKNEYNVIQFEGLFVAYLLNVARSIKKFTPIVLRQHNVESVIRERLFRNSRFLPARLWLLLQYRRFLAYEADICVRFDRCFMITRDDEQKIEELSPGVRASVIPGGVDCSYFYPQNITEEPYSIVFIGVMDWLPNVEGIYWFCNEVFPQIKRKIPASKLYIVGSDPPNDVKKLANNDVIITGFVDDVRAYMAKGQVFIVPLKSGSGMRIKILNALAMARPVVSTSIGCEGIGVMDGKNIYIADTAEQFAKKITELLNNENERRRLGSEGLNLVKEKYQWERVIEEIEEAYKRMPEN